MIVASITMIKLTFDFYGQLHVPYFEIRNPAATLFMVSWLSCAPSPATLVDDELPYCFPPAERWLSSCFPDYLWPNTSITWNSSQCAWNTLLTEREGRGIVMPAVLYGKCCAVCVLTYHLYHISFLLSWIWIQFGMIVAPVLYNAFEEFKNLKPSFPSYILLLHL